MFLNKSQAAFRHQVLNLAEDYDHLYFWTVTFYTLHPDWECFGMFRRFLDHLQKVLPGNWGGVRVAELHKEHGVHFHLVVTERLAADFVRRVGRCHGIGRVHVEVVKDKRGAEDYLAKYLTKQFAAPKTTPTRKVTAHVFSFGFAHVFSMVAENEVRQRNARRWASFGKTKRRTRVKDMENASDYWLYRKTHNLPWLGYAPECYLRRAWVFDVDNTAAHTLKKCWFYLKKNHPNIPSEAVALATGRAVATDLGPAVWRSREIELGPAAPF